MADNGFSALLGGANKFSRRFGSNSAGNSIDPYVTGFGFIKIADLPPAVQDFTPTVSPTSPRTPIGRTGFINFLESSCLSVTLPGATMNTAEFQGTGGVKYTIPTYADFETTFSMRFVELQGLPLLTTIGSWFRMIRDYRAGVSRLDGSSYSKSNYAGSVYVWTTLPDGKTIQNSALLTGVYPLRDPISDYGFDVSTMDKLEVDIDFNCDYMWRENWVAAQCQGFATEYAETGLSTINLYGLEDGIAR